MRKLTVCLAFVVLCFANAFAQPRLVVKETEKTPPVLAPVTFQAKYEGGMFGFSKKQEGYLKFDDANFRFVFFDKNNKEQFGIPYKDLIVVYPTSQTSQSTSGKVVQNVPIPGAGIAGMLMKDKRRYMVIGFDDRDMDVKGTINFKIDDVKLLESAIQTLGWKAEMQQRGEAFYRPQKKTPSN